jgi:hypothetical protein
MSGARPLELLPLGDVSMGAMLWRVVACDPDRDGSEKGSGTLHLTVTLQASWFYDDAGVFEATTPKLITELDDVGPPNSDLAPHLFDAELWFEGDACAVGAPEASVAVRMAAGRRRPLVDKTLHVYGKRKRLRDGLSAPTPFDRLPLDCGRTRAGHVAPSDGELANVFDPTDGERPSGFARVTPAWRTIDDGSEPRLSDGVLEIPESFDWQAFQATPLDQRCAYFAGDEWIALEGLQAAQRRLRLLLPNIRAEARLFAQSAQHGGHPIALRCDGVGIDGLMRRCNVRWRGSFPIVARTMLDAFTIAAGVAVGDEHVDWAAAPVPEFDAPADSSESAALLASPIAGQASPAHARSKVVGTEASEQMREALGLPQRPAETPAQRQALAAARLGFSETDAEVMRAQLGIPAAPPSRPGVERPATDQVETASLSEKRIEPKLDAVPFQSPRQSSPVPPPSAPVVRAATTRSGHEAPHQTEGRATITLADDEPSLEHVLPFAFSDHQRPLEAELPEGLHAPVSAAPDDEDAPRLSPTIAPHALPPDGAGGDES